eukprot:TRINITY_DN4185_c0_g1_i1.p1 TRINITY_DN4185_c0_g1~~TRINITY_DN4185_c0_g1_i1.p1  ORF type:complete len:247 (-),score=98.54 TRINITY_DN4185_c0_g1_i1:154-894(-)
MDRDLLNNESIMESILNNDIALSNTLRKKTIGGVCEMVTMPEEDSGFLLVNTPGISNINDSQLPHLLVAIEYLTALEGDFWRRIRGLGLAYHCSIKQSTEKGLLSLWLFHATDPAGALREALKIIGEYVEEEKALKIIDFEAAKSSVISGILAREHTVLSTASERLNSWLQNSPPHRNSHLAKQVNEVTMEQTIEAMNRYFTPLLKHESSSLYAAVAPQMTENLHSLLTSMKREPTIIEEIKEFFD